MGNKTSKVDYCKVDTPLKCVLENFDLLYTRKVKKSYFGHITKKQLQILCEQKWPTLGVEWPPEGTFDPEVAWALYGAVIRLPNLMYQFRYIVPWAQATSKPPVWMKEYIIVNGLHFPLPRPPQSQPQLQPLTQPPPQSEPLSQPPTQSPPQPQPLTQPPTQSLPQSQPLSQPPTQSPPQPQPLTQPQPPPQPQPLTQPPPQHQAVSQPCNVCVPFTSTDLHNQNIQNRPSSTNASCIDVVPLTTIDLLNWRAQYPPFSTDPKPLISLVESIFLIYHPSLDDCKRILYVLFTREERERILTEASKAFPGFSELSGELVLLRESPDWNSRVEKGRKSHRVYHQALLEGLKLAARKPTDLSKVAAVRQGTNESPSEFLERLLEAYREYTTIDPEDPIFLSSVDLTFIFQSAPDIRDAIQNMHDYPNMSRSELLEIAQDVFNNREYKQEQLLIRQLTKAITSAQQCAACSPGQRTYNGRSKPLRRNQCAYCKELGHWKHECPQQRWVGPPWPKPRFA
ncbi:uncharacterized protein LOC130865329 [Chionomys nivalis]|uniref:uncharacterized protein LOC130865329 n=1 Tax=Chionomys nivalis TaxID=269649 RepID=UPI002591634F|nr:uncharacterized protein LOC130865329 [Chionomys nivalis]